MSGHTGHPKQPAGCAEKGVVNGFISGDLIFLLDPLVAEGRGI
jgi:hypothetical protein